MSPRFLLPLLPALLLAAPSFARSPEAEARVPVVQDYEPSPAIWKLADEDTTIYLFGTFHVLPEGFRWRSAAFDRVAAQAEELVVETSDADSDAVPGEILVTMMSGIADRVPTSERLGPEAGAKWLKLAAMADMPEALFDRMPPILAVLTVGLGQLDEMGSEREYGVETVLETEFAAAGKPIGSIEDANAIFANVLAIDEDLLLSELRAELVAWDGEDPKSFLMGEDEAASEHDFALEHAWARGEQIDDLEFGDGEFGELFEKVLLEDRNRAWAGWLDDRLDRPGTVLVAVGAGHFYGPNSVQAMLAERGLEAVAVD